MRHFRIALLGICALVLVLGTAGAGLNPQDPGLGGGLAVYQANRSRICIDCHSAIPSGATHRGTHFVYDPFTTGRDTVYTNSGGGGGGGMKAARNGAEYFRVTAWGTAGNFTWSKYGGTTTDNNNYFTAVAADNAGMGTNRAASAANYQDLELICESCHNLVKNVAGGNNLVAPMTTNSHLADTGFRTQVTNWAEGEEATLCVGCHGYMYTTNATNPPRYADARNWVDASGTTTKRDNAHRHYIDGAPYNQNHHVMTADSINNTLAPLGLYWRDTLFVDTSANGWASGSQTVTTTYTAGARGVIPMLATWNTDGGKVKATNAANINCVHCHSAPHTGDITTGATILRDTNAGGDSASGATQAINRLADSRNWMRLNDGQYCFDCHRLKP